MDPITHTIVGLSLTALAGEKISITSAVTWGAVLGSLAPDFDIVMQVFGDFPYLKHHRGVSHSIPGILTGATLMAFLVWLIFGGSFGLAFGWTMIGAISHISLDVLNSYGAMFLWPFSKRKFTLNLLVIADPVLVGLYALNMIVPNFSKPLSVFMFALSLVYLGFRYKQRGKTEKYLSLFYSHLNPQKIVVTPAMLSLWNWSFFVENEQQIYVGEYKVFSKEIEQKRVLTKKSSNEFVEMALESKLGSFFQSFTPHCYWEHYEKDGKNTVVLSDLRYFFRGEFLHHATIVFDEHENMSEAIFQPYSKNRKVPVHG